MPCRLLLCVVVAALTLFGCGSEPKDTRAPVQPDVTAAPTGTARVAAETLGPSAGAPEAEHGRPYTPGDILRWTQSLPAPLRERWVADIVAMNDRRAIFLREDVV